MLKNDVAVVGAGLGGATVAYGRNRRITEHILLTDQSKITERFQMRKMFLY